MTDLTLSDRLRIALAPVRHALSSRAKVDDPSTLVFQEHRVAYIPIPKAANSSTRAALLPLVGLNPSDVDRIQDFRGFRKMRYSEFRKMRSDDWFVFSIVRNPFSRYASAYLDKVVTRGELLRAFRRMGMNKGDSFGRFLSLLAAWPDQILNDHVSLQDLMLEAPARDGLKVFKLENLAVDWPVITGEIKARTGIEIPPLERRNPGKAKASWQSIYDADTVALAKKLGAADFARFGYDINQMDPQPLR